MVVKVSRLCCGLTGHSQQRYQPLRHLFCSILIFITFSLLIILWPQDLFLRLWSILYHGFEKECVVTIYPENVVPSRGDPDCHYYNCFDVYKCGRLEEHQLSVYVYPPVKYVDKFGVMVTGPVSREFQSMLDAVMQSSFYTDDPERACIFIPSLDLLNQNNLRLKKSSQILASLPYWNEGRNHLLVNMLPGSIPDYNSTLDVFSGQAMIAGGGFSIWTYRHGFDISIPIFNPYVAYLDVPSRPANFPAKWLVTSSQLNIHYEYRQEFLVLAEEHPEFLVLDKCSSDITQNFTVRCRGDEIYEYPQILRDSTFSLIVRGARLGQTSFYDAMYSGSIPVVIANGYVLPFSDVIDWKEAAVVIYEEEISELMYILKSISEERIAEMKQQVNFLFNMYFKDMKSIVFTVLQIINDRVFPHVAKSYEGWNQPSWKTSVQTPLFLPYIAPKSQGFTAVILTYDRLESLFQVMLKVVKAPSLTKVLVVWNNQNKSPPPASVWPKINKPLKVVQTRENKLSNRFYPYDEIETEAILAIDDDIIMLTADELEFGFEVWREFPDRIVGYPSRVHLWDNITSRWKYESEWTNEISMVLTGAAFYHKYWSYMYTTSMPGDIKSWVDEHMNCEDIAMNFLVTNMTGKAPIKVAPRKKFKCPECTNTEMLSADLSHMMERSECVNKFATVYGHMPLKPVEFRADPVLYKDNFPEKLKKFNDIGFL